jgi:hypothetical protein
MWAGTGPLLTQVRVLRCVHSACASCTTAVFDLRGNGRALALVGTCLVAPVVHGVACADTLVRVLATTPEKVQDFIKVSRCLSLLGT